MLFAGFGLLSAVPWSAVAAAQNSQSQLFDGISVEARYSGTQGSGRGYARLALDFENLAGEEQLVVWTLEPTFSTTVFERGSLRLGPGERGRVERLLPTFGGLEHGMDLRVLGAPSSMRISGGGATTQAAGGMMPFPHFGWHSAASRGLWWLVPSQAEAIDAATAQRLADELGRKQVTSFGSPLNTGNYVVANITYADLPHDPRAWTSASALRLDSRGPLPGQAQLESILDFARLGGVVVLDGLEPGELARRAPALAALIEGRFQLMEYPARDRSHQGTIETGEGSPGIGKVFSLGLGYLVVRHGAPAREFEANEPLWWALELAHSWLHPISGREPVEAPGLRVQAPLPVEVLALLGVLLAILLGPVTFWRSRVSGRPISVLWRMPLASLIATVVILTIGVVRFGASVREASHSAAILDERSGRLAQGERRELFAGFTLLRGLRPGPGTVVMPVEAPDTFGPFGRHRATPAQYQVLDDGALLAGDFLPTRRRVGHTLLTVRGTRQRVEFERAGNGYAARSALERELLDLWYADRLGGLWRLSADGKAGGALPMQAVRVAELESFLVDHPLPWMLHDAKLPPNTYLALLDGPLASEGLGLNARRESPGTHFLLGIQGEQR